MTLITRYGALASPPSDLPLMAWETGLTPNKRWVPGRLPASAAPVPSWASNEGSNLVQSTAAPIVGMEAGVKHAEFNGADGCQMSISGLTEPELRTIVVVARPNTGDTFFTSSASAPIFSTNSHIVSQGVSADTVSMGGGSSPAAPLTALRDRWHIYAISISGPGGSGVLVVDNADTTFTVSGTAQTQLRLARSSTANYRQLRVLEVLTSTSTFTAAQLKALYPKAKAWYPNLAW